MIPRVPWASARACARFPGRARGSAESWTAPQGSRLSGWGGGWEAAWLVRSQVTPGRPVRLGEMLGQRVFLSGTRNAVTRAQRACSGGHLLLQMQPAGQKDEPFRANERRLTKCPSQVGREGGIYR